MTAIIQCIKNEIYATDLEVEVRNLKDELARLKQADNIRQELKKHRCTLKKLMKGKPADEAGDGKSAPGCHGVAEEATSMHYV
jgi:hypothetical protein